jgi:flagellar basal-body rod protein FlgB
MVDDIQAVTRSLGEKALDAYALRHQTLANNIANVNVEGYQPLRVNFEEQLAGLQAAVAGGADDKTLAALISKVNAHVEPMAADAVTGDAQQRIDDAMTLILQNTVQYEAVLTALARESSLTRMAVTGEPQ